MAKKHKTFKTPAMNMCMSAFFGMDNSTISLIRDLAKEKKNTKKLDDPDTAGVWVMEHVGFEIEGAEYRIKKVDDIEVTTDEDFKRLVKKSSLTTPQKCWVISLMNGFNMQWTMGNIAHSKAGVKSFFEPLYAGDYGYHSDDDIREYMYNEEVA